MPRQPHPGTQRMNPGKVGPRSGPKPKRYKKFVAQAATATLIAQALAPVKEETK